MELEQRYLTIKLSDLERAETKTPGITEYIGNLLRIIEDVRTQSGKVKLEGIVIEKDWPEYEPTLKLLSERVDAESDPVQLTEPVQFTNSAVRVYRKCNVMAAGEFAAAQGDAESKVLTQCITFIGGFINDYFWTEYPRTLPLDKRKLLADLIWIRKTKCKQQ